MGTARNDPDAGIEPAYAAPAHACDAHFHVFGAAERYPYGADLRYPPPHEPLEAYLALARRIGFTRFVFVQPSAYGIDNSCMFDAMRQLDPSIRRGIVDLDETSASDRQLAPVAGTRRAWRPREYFSGTSAGGGLGGLDDAAHCTAFHARPRGWVASRFPRARLAGE